MFTDPVTVAWTLVSRPWDGADGYLDDVAADWRDGSPHWVVADGDDSPVGVVGLRRHDERSAGLRYLVAPWARGRGVALRACHAAAEFAFGALGVSRLTWEAIVGNHVARLVAHRLGFRFEGTRRAAAEQRGVPVDLWTGALLPGELRDPSAPPPADYPTARRRAAVLSRPQPSLPTEHPQLRLRPLRDDDVDLVAAACRDQESIRWTTLPQPYSRGMAVGFVHQYAIGGWRRGDMAVFALADPADKYCGAIDLRLSHPDPAISDIGFNTAPWARGRGFMTAAVEAVCRFGFRELGFTRIEWKAYVGNVASRRVAQKAGFTMEGTVHSESIQRGRRMDCWIGAKVNTDDED